MSPLCPLLAKAGKLVGEAKGMGLVPGVAPV